MISAPLTHEQLRKALEAAGLTVHPAAAGGLRRARGGVSTTPPPKRSFTQFEGGFQRSAWQRFTSLLKLSWPSARRPGYGRRRHWLGPLRRTERRPLSLPLPSNRGCCDLPARFDPDLIAKLDPDLEASLSKQGFKVTGYRLELFGYREQDQQTEAQAKEGLWAGNTNDASPSQDHPPRRYARPPRRPATEARPAWRP